MSNRNDEGMPAASANARPAPTQSSQNDTNDCGNEPPNKRNRYDGQRDSSPSRTNNNMDGNGVQLTFPIKTPEVWLVGGNIKDIQQRYRVSIKIGKITCYGPDVLITIKGSRQDAENAKQQVLSYIERGWSHSDGNGIESRCSLLDEKDKKFFDMLREKQKFETGECTKAFVETRRKRAEWYRTETAANNEWLEQRRKLKGDPVEADELFLNKMKKEGEVRHNLYVYLFENVKTDEEGNTSTASGNSNGDKSSPDMKKIIREHHEAVRKRLYFEKKDADEAKAAEEAKNEAEPATSD